MTVLVGVSANVEYSLRLPDTDADKINLPPSERICGVAGSSCNVAIALHNAGIQNVKLLVTTGDDDNRATISSDMARREIDTFLLPWRDITNVSYSLIQGGRSQLVCYKGDYLLGKLEEGSLIEGQVRQVRPKFRVGTGVQIADAPVIYTMFGEIYDEEGKLIMSTNVLNPGLTLLEELDDAITNFLQLEMLRKLLQRTHILVVNQKELEALLSSMKLNSIDQLRAFGPDGSMRVLVTRSQEGAVLYNGEPSEIPVDAFSDVEVVDPVGAGDCFLGYFIAMLVLNVPVHQALEMASAASAITVGRVGGSNIPKLAEVEKFLAERRSIAQPTRT
ncbi:carbohydrate kinase family protein [Patescibacteria group bacterium]|nr:carbohydrate kinase family protein [Patescibacteria group bacterium]